MIFIMLSRFLGQQFGLGSADGLLPYSGLDSSQGESPYVSGFGSMLPVSEGILALFQMVPCHPAGQLRLVLVSWQASESESGNKVS